MKLSILIPLYNEGGNIEELLQKLERVNLPDSVTGREIIIVDDCSTDNSLSVVTNYSAQYNDVFIYPHEVNKGKGAAVKTAYSKSTGDILLIQDADLELSPDDIPSLINAMNQLKIEFINGSRYLPGVLRPLSSFRRYYMNKLFTFITSFLVNVNLTDLACGYKLVSRKLWEQINLKEQRFGFEAELIIKAMRIRKNNIAEVPVSYFPRNKGDGKKLRNIDGLKIFFTIFKYGVLKLK